MKTLTTQGGNMPDENYTNTYASNDLAIAAFLTLAGFHPTQINRSDGSKVLFVFDRTPSLEDAIEKYWSDEQLVNPKRYFDTIKHLKTQIYSR